MNRIYLIDCNGISHWQWHSSATDANGNERTLAEKVTEWWRQFCESMKPTHAIACFDGRDNWRKQVYAEYKSARAAKPMDEAKIAALKTMPGLWESFGVKVMHYNTFEADDVIATLCARFGDEAELVTIATDKDMMQLVEQLEGGPTQYDPRPNKANECVYYDAAKVEEKLGVPPHRVAELLAIMGDASDSVPGIKGIGRVQAINAIKQTKTANEIFRKAAKHELANILPANQDKIVAGRADFDLSLKLVSLRFDVPVEIDINDCALSAREVAA
jgi:5'-3' exonuclease